MPFEYTGPSWNRRERIRFSHDPAADNMLNIALNIGEDVVSALLPVGPVLNVLHSVGAAALNGDDRMGYIHENGNAFRVGVDKGLTEATVEVQVGENKGEMKLPWTAIEALRNHYPVEQAVPEPATLLVDAAPVPEGTEEPAHEEPAHEEPAPPPPPPPPETHAKRGRKPKAH